MCTFCDWGGVTFSKVKKFNLERIQEELDWMGQNKIEIVTNTDANFGIFKDRDMQITNMLIDRKQKYGYPVLFDTNWNKNASPQLTWQLNLWSLICYVDSLWLYKALILKS